MPEICRFFGIVIKMFFDDHNPPHFHAEYGDDSALIDIRNLSVFSGRLSPRVMGLVYRVGDAPSAGTSRRLGASSSSAGTAKNSTDRVRLTS